MTRGHDVGSGPLSGFRRRQPRACANISVVIVRANGHKAPGRVLNVGVGGMQLSAEGAPAYGEKVTLITQLEPAQGWLVLRGTVRWLLRSGFGVTFENLSQEHAAALRRFVSQNAA